jgi:hypothetical protein
LFDDDVVNVTMLVVAVSFLGRVLGTDYPILTIFQQIQLFVHLFVANKTKTKQAICFTAFLVGFITVLCIGNYFRAKRAQDRQRQRRLAKLADDANFGTAVGGGGGAATAAATTTSIGGGGGTVGSDVYSGRGEYSPPTVSSGVQV